MERANTLGTIKISEEVIAIIAANAAAKTQGIAEMSSTLTDGLVNMLGRTNDSKGVRTEMTDETTVVISLYVAVYHGYRIPDTALRVQEKVKTAVEELTGYTVSAVHVFIQDILFNSSPAPLPPTDKG